MNSLLKPWYVWRPGQIINRLTYSGRAKTDTPQLVQTAWGGKLKLDLRRQIGRAIYTTGVFDLAVSEILARLAYPGARAVDVGANIGYMSLLLAARCSPKGSLTAFEPHPALSQQLKQNISLNPWPEKLTAMEIKACAVSEKSGRSQLIIPEAYADNDGVAMLGNDTASEGSSIEVPITTLDEEFPSEKIDIMKMDIEGSELAALTGAPRLLAEKRLRNLVFESSDEPSNPVFSLLRNANYKIYRIGWALNGPQIAPLKAPPLHRPYESPSFLATVDEDQVNQACQPRGWQCLCRWA